MKKAPLAVKAQPVNWKRELVASFARPKSLYMVAIPGHPTLSAKDVGRILVAKGKNKEGELRLLPLVDNGGTLFVGEAEEFLVYQIIKGWYRDSDD